MTLLDAAVPVSPTGAPPSGTFEAHLATLDKDPSRAGFQFELSAAYWLTADPVWGPLIKRVWLWDAWTDRASAAGVADPDDDLGIDLAVELISGEWMAVQVKHRHHVPTRDIDSFLGAVAGGIGWPPGRAGGWDHAMLIMSCPWDRVWANGRRKLTGAGAHIVDRSVLAGSAVLWPTFEELTAGAAPTRRPPRAPRPHQTAAVADVAGVLAGGADRATLVMACGTGKTLTGQRAAEAVLPDGGVVVVAAPTLSLLDQVACAWLRDAVPGGSLTDWVVVGSDPTVAAGGRAVANADVRHLPAVTTDPAVLAVWLRRRRAKGALRVVFTTHASLPVVAAALDSAHRWADLLIVDEAHRVTGRGVDAEMATGDGFRARRRLFCTATPRVFTAAAKSSAAAGGLEVLSMDDEARFGPEAHHLSFAAAAEAGLVCDLSVLASVVTDDDVARAIGDRALLDLAGGVVDADLVAAAVAVSRAAADRDLRRLLTFHSTVKRARQFAAVLNTVWPLVAPAGGTLVAEAVSGDTSALDRRAALRRLADLEATADLEAGPQPVDRMVLCSARLLGEGIDVPAVDAVVFCDPRHSPVDIAQAVGRACRTAPGKTVGTVVVPVHLPAGAASPDTAVEHDVWGGVFASLAAVISHDERFRAVVTDACFELGRRPGTLYSGGDGGVSVVEFLAGGDVDSAFLASVEATAIDLAAPAWWNAAGELAEFYDGRQAPPARNAVDPAERRLAKWASRQREAHAAGVLAPDRVAALETVPGWVWNPVEANWQIMLHRLIGWAGQHPEAFDHGILVVPIKGVWVHNAEGTPQNLGQWASRQRTDIASAAAGRPPSQQVDYRLRSRLLADQIPGWSLDPTRAISEARWHETAAEVAAVAGELGRLPKKGDGPLLAGWIHRTWGAARKGALTDRQIAVCEQIPHWRWQGQ